MNKEDVISALARVLPDMASRFKVKRMGLFGSYVRGEQNAGSDLDVLVELREPIGWDIVELRDDLEGATGLRVDLVLLDAIKPALRESIMREVVFI